jgi:polysaccharide biosynthesis protein PslG
MQHTACRAAVLVITAFAAVFTAPTVSTATAARAPVSSHAQLYTCCTPLPMKQRIFAESRELGANFVRVDIELSAIFSRRGRAAGWRQLDQVIELSRHYRLPVVGIVLSTPGWLSSCPASRNAPLCAPRDMRAYGELVGAVAAHARGKITHWEIGNEPDESWAFKSGPESYARMLTSAHDAIKHAAPDARVAIGGLGSLRSVGWLGRVFRTPEANAARTFDIASVHVRAKLRDLAHELRRWRRVFARYGFRGPIWVTEHGYSSDSRHQDDPRFKGGPGAQASYLRRSIPALASAGAGQVFVTLRDNLGGRWASEGLETIGGPPPYPARRKPAFATIQRLTGAGRPPAAPLTSVGPWITGLAIGPGGKAPTGLW